MENHLKNIYGYNKFRPYQKDIINDILNKNNVSVIMPTGGGKSMLYQFPATFTNKVTLVISPLVSLMADQCLALTSKGINCINLSEQGIYCKNLPRCTCDICKLSRNGKDISIIYSTPEWFSLHANKLYKLKNKIQLIACDEAHCISNWSHDFRPSYKKIGNALKNFRDTPILLVTATATPIVLEDMYNILDIEEISEYSLGSKRPNLAINIFDKSYWSLNIVKKDEPTIVYTQTRKECEKLATDFQNNDIECLFYHAGMPDKDRSNVHKRFLEGDIKLVTATIAFGMGIDKSDIRHVINYGIPTDLETYYQEIGRAGRDGLPCKSSLYYDDKDFSKAVFLIKKGAENQLQKRYNHLDIFKNFLQEPNICRQHMINYYLSNGSLPEQNPIIERCEICDNCNGKIQGIYYDTTVDANKILEILILEKYSYGMVKTLQMCKNVGLKDYIRIIINELCKKNYINKLHSKYGILYEVTIKKHCQNLQILLPEKIYESIMKNTHSYDRARKYMSNKYNIQEKTFINDKVLLNIKQSRPSSAVELLMIDGITEDFVFNYGSEFLELIKPSCKQINPKSNSPLKQNNSTVSNTVQETINLFKTGKSIKDISTLRNFKPMTIENHISEYYGFFPKELNQSFIKITPKMIQEVIDAKKTLVECNKLTPIMEKINDISWLQLKIITNALKNYKEEILLNMFE